MGNTVIVTVDGLGNLQVDFSGYTGNACTNEEAQLRSLLADLGLNAKPRSSKRKNQQNSATTMPKSPAKGKVST